MIQGYVTVGDMAKRWNLSVRQVQKFCSEGRIPDTIRFGIAWAIPDNAKKPTRTVRSKPGRKQKDSNGEEAEVDGLR